MKFVDIPASGIHESAYFLINAAGVLDFIWRRAETLHVYQPVITSCFRLIVWPQFALQRAFDNKTGIYGYRIAQSYVFELSREEISSDRIWLHQ